MTERKPHPSRIIPPPPKYDPPIVAVIYDPVTGRILQTMTGLETHIGNCAAHYLKVEEHRRDWDVTHRVHEGVLVPAAAEPQEIVDAREAARVRRVRGKMVAESDWAETPGGQRRLSEDQKKAWEDYRQALFDLPKQQGFPHKVEWPQAPK